MFIKYQNNVLNKSCSPPHTKKTQHVKKQTNKKIICDPYKLLFSGGTLPGQLQLLDTSWTLVCVRISGVTLSLHFCLAAYW